MNGFLYTEIKAFSFFENEDKLEFPRKKIKKKKKNGGGCCIPSFPCIHEGKTREKREATKAHGSLTSQLKNS